LCRSRRLSVLGSSSSTLLGLAGRLVAARRRITDGSTRLRHAGRVLIVGVVVIVFIQARIVHLRHLVRNRRRLLVGPVGTTKRPLPSTCQRFLDLLVEVRKLE